MKLIRPNKKYINQYTDAIEENSKYRPNGEQLFSEPDLVINKSYELEHGINLPLGYVKATTLWLIDGGRFIGEISIRHELNSALLNYGGNIGYEVRHSECFKGYGTNMLSMALEYCRKELKLNHVLITCDDENSASRIVIEKNNGELENTIENNLDRGTVKTRRYWIHL